MRMKSCWQLAIVLLCITAFAGASTIGVTIAKNADGSSHNEMGGPTSGQNLNVYYYPYYLQLSTGQTVMVACDDYYDEATIGEQYTATTHTFADLNGTLFYNSANASADTLKYQEVAWLFDQFQGPPNPFPDNGVNAAINYAIWDIMDPTAATYNQSGNSSAYWIGQAQAASANFGTYDFSQFVIYTPSTWKDNSAPGDRPQEYFGKLPSSPVPEPPTALLWLAGLAGFGLLAYKRRSQTARP